MQTHKFFTTIEYYGANKAFKCILYIPVRGVTEEAAAMALSSSFFHLRPSRDCVSSITAGCGGVVHNIHSLSHSREVHTNITTNAH